MLHTPIRDTGSSRFCGPTAIASITGLKGSDVRDAIRQARGDIRSVCGRHMPVAGLSNVDLLATMNVLGWRVVEEWHEADSSRNQPSLSVPWPTTLCLTTFKTFLLKRGEGGPFVVNVTGHYIAVSHGEVCDADACQLPVPIPEYLARKRVRYAKAWVRHWWRFEQ